MQYIRVAIGLSLAAVVACSSPSPTGTDSAVLPVDRDQDGFFDDVDCDDSNPSIFPGAQENCTDGVDNNCDGSADGDLVCVDPCRAAALEFSSYGCEFYAADLPQRRYDKKWAIVVSNPSHDAEASVVIEDAQGQLATLSVPPLEVRTFEDAVRTHRIENGGIAAKLFRVTSDIPVVAYQFNSLDTIDAASTDASLLVPTHALDTDYYAMNYDSAFTGDSFITVFAASPDTTVTITTDIGVDGPLTATLQPFEAMTVLAPEMNVTLTGARIEADGPIGVFSGNRCTNVPVERKYCDHLEQQLFPRVAYGTNYFVGKFHERQICDPTDRIRILADRDNTSITINPPVAGPWILGAGEWVEFAIAESVQVLSDKAIMVGHFMSGSGEGECDDEGDPMFVLQPPVEQFRSEYTFLTPFTYDTDYVDIVAPIGTEVLFDDFPIDVSETPIGPSGYSLTSFIVADRQHRVVADQPIGVIVYGTGGPNGPTQAVSYGYPAGLNLRQINVD